MGAGVFLYKSIDSIIEKAHDITFPKTKGMVLIKGADVKIGKSGSYDDDGPCHTIHLDSYWIDKHEVTVEEYVKYCKSNNVDIPPDPQFPSMPNYFTDPRWRKYPVVNVTWWEAIQYCKAIGKRLPTEAEWENAARYWDQEDHLFPFKDQNGVPTGNYPDISYRGYYPKAKLPTKAKNDGYSFTARVGSFKANGNGTYDLDGNVSEWCMDAYSKNYYKVSPRKNPCNKDTTAKRCVVRGPSWAQWYDVVTTRNRFNKGRRSRYIGFRCALDAKK